MSPPNSEHRAARPAGPQEHHPGPAARHRAGPEGGELRRWAPGLCIQHRSPSTKVRLTRDRRLRSLVSCGPTRCTPGILRQHLPLQVWPETREPARIRRQSRDRICVAPGCLGEGEPHRSDRRREARRSSVVSDSTQRMAALLPPPISASPSSRKYQVRRPQPQAGAESAGEADSTCPGCRGRPPAAPAPTRGCGHSQVPAHGRPWCSQPLSGDRNRHVPHRTAPRIRGGNGEVI